MRWQEQPDWVEGDLFFDFSKALNVAKLDAEGSNGHGLSHILKAVDFVVEWEHQVWLIEVKDPENGTIPEKYKAQKQRDFLGELESGTLISKHLFPKLRDSLIYLGMNQGIKEKPMVYMTLIGLTSLQSAELEGLANKLWKTEWIAGPKQGWSKSFKVVCLNIPNWNRLVTQCPITRISSTGT